MCRLYSSRRTALPESRSSFASDARDLGFEGRRDIGHGRIVPCASKYRNRAESLKRGRGDPEVSLFVFIGRIMASGRPCNGIQADDGQRSIGSSGRLVRTVAVGWLAVETGRPRRISLRRSRDGSSAACPGAGSVQQAHTQPLPHWRAQCVHIVSPHGRRCRGYGAACG